MNPGGLDMTPEEEVLSRILTKSGGEQFLSRLASAIRAERGLNPRDRGEVRDFLDDALDASKSVKEAGDPAREYLKDKLAHAYYDRDSGYEKAAIAAGMGVIGHLIASWAHRTGTPVDSFMDALSILAPLICLGTSATEIHSALKAGYDVKELERILLGRKKPVPPPSKLHV